MKWGISSAGVNTVYKDDLHLWTVLFHFFDDHRLILKEVNQGILVLKLFELVHFKIGITEALVGLHFKPRAIWTF